VRDCINRPRQRYACAPAALVRLSPIRDNWQKYQEEFSAPVF
jgi:hypothetical protein